MNSPQRKTAAFLGVSLSPAPAAAQRRGAWQTFCGNAAGRAVRGACGDADKRGDEFAGEAYALARKNKPGAVPDAQQSGNSVPRLFTRDEVQGMSAREVSENYDAIRESMGLWDKDGELPENMPESGTVDVPAVDSESPAGDNGENIDFYVARMEKFCRQSIKAGLAPTEENL